MILYFLRVTHASILASSSRLPQSVSSWCLFVANVTVPYSIAGMPLHFRWRRPVAQYSAVFLPCSVTWSHSRSDLRFHTTLTNKKLPLLYSNGRTEVFEMSNSFRYCIFLIICTGYLFRYSFRSKANSIK